MKYASCLLLCLSFYYCSHAQKTNNRSNTSNLANKKALTEFNNSIRLHTGEFSYNGRPSPLRRFAIFTGIYYERRIHKNWFAGSGFSSWNKGIGSIIPCEIPEILGEYDTARGTLTERAAYKMADLYAAYKLNIFNRRHFLNCKLGLSYTWGINSYIEKKTPSHGPLYEGMEIWYEKEAGYLGIVPQISYDFFFLKNRICVGVDVRGRYYTGFTQYDYGAHAGFNF